VRLAYNYTTKDFACYPPEAEGSVLFDTIEGADEEDEKIPPLISNGDTFVIYDVSHWDGNDLAHFGSLHDGDKAGLMEGLTITSEGIYGLIGIKR
jgi:hypothetical protein